MILFIHKDKIIFKNSPLIIYIFYNIYFYLASHIIHIFWQSMSTNQRKEQLKKFLQKFDETPIKLSQLNRPIGQMPMQQFIITYFGMCFLEGYRIIEKIQENIFVMSLMEYQKGGNLSYLGCQGKRRQFEGHEKHGIFRIVCVQFNQKLNEDREHRQQVYRDIKQIIDFFCLNGHPQNDQNQNSKLNIGSNNKDIQSYKLRQNCPGIEINFLFAYNFLYSSIKYEQLVKNQKLIIEKFYNRYYGFGKRSDKNEQRQNFGLKILDQREQGTKLHELVQLMIKGSGLIRNNQYLNKQVLHQAKFSYKLTKIINSICLIIGREMIEGGYVTISSEKWMRKFSAKRFKKFDLLLRNSNRVCVIDWKFSRVNADQKIATQIFKQKNLQYFKLAKQQYNAEVELKFYCFHQSSTEHHHKFTTADYEYSKQQISLQEKQYRINENNQIQISSSDSENDMNAHRIEDRIKSNSGNNGQYMRNMRNLQKNNIFGRLEDKQKINQFSSITYDKKSQNFVFTQEQQPQHKSSKLKQTITKGQKTSKNNKKTQLQQILNDLVEEQAQIIENAGNDYVQDDCVCLSGNSMIKQKERQNQKQRERIRRIQKQIQKQFLKQMQSSKSKDKKNKKSRSKSKSNPKSRSKSNPKINKPSQNSKGNPKQKVYQITYISDEDQVISISHDSEKQKNDKNKHIQSDAENNKVCVNGNMKNSQGSKQIHFMHINSNKNDLERQYKQPGPSEPYQKVPKSQINQQKNNLRNKKISQSQLYQQKINVAEIQFQNMQNSVIELQIQESVDIKIPKISSNKVEQTKNQQRKGEEFNKNIMSTQTNNLLNVKEKKNMSKAKKTQHFIVID